ncbi:glycosyl hydrolase family 61-domain-containing protein [Crucibulum laeve]|uniref:AA9 family lytic polysaccharide monooxygenase n=1 Tax=Crucibulum laeve TaxID=68775 RepID=A0A5C3LJV0_9AGAR|nr:glycosyl hydrolase family 61-domain-containing protein [Crucibulum laeve]
MQLTTFLALAVAASTAVAHSTVYGVWVNGVDQGDGRNQYIRSPPSNSPVKDLKSSAIQCNVNNRAVPKTISVKAGDTLTFEWHHDNRDDDIIDPTHKGPVLVYMAPTDINSWTKLYQDGFSDSWAVDRLIAAHGQHSIIVPDVPAGDYLMRAEIVALHEGDTLFTQNAARGAQFYPSCVQIKVVTSGSQTLPGGAVFLGAYTDSTPGVLFNLYGGPSPSTYIPPGPAVWSGAHGGSIGRVGIPGQGAIGTPVPAVATTVVPSTTKAATTSSATTPNTGAVALYGQCGGVSSFFICLAFWGLNEFEIYRPALPDPPPAPRVLATT